MKVLVFSPFKNKTKYVIFSILLLICYIIGCIIFQTYEYYEFNIELLQNESVNRKITAIADIQFIEDYVNFNNSIEIYYPIFNNELILNNSLEYFVVNYFNDNIEKVILGSSELNENQVIISEKLYNSLYYGDELNFEIKVTINDQEKTFEVVGVTDNSSAQIYMNIKTFESLFGLEETKFYLLATDYMVVDTIISDFIGNGFYAELSDSSVALEVESFINIKNIYKYIMFTLFILITIFIYFIIKNIINEERKNIALLKAVGYRVLKIEKILFIRLMVMLIFVCICFQVLCSFYFIIFENLSYLSVTKNNILISFVIFISIFLNLIFHYKRIRNINVFTTLQDY